MRRLRLALVLLLVGLMLIVPSMAMAAAAAAGAGASIAGVSLVPAAVTAGVVVASTAIVISESGDKTAAPSHHINPD